MWAEVNGERKKVACGPCIRGHRSSKCDHRDRVLVEVRKPGRPLSSCPHPSGSCSCERVVINYTIPKSSECACPSERAQNVATVSGNSRIQKSRRKSTAISSQALEKAIKAGQDTETDASSYTRASTERSGSNEASPPSSASSTPHLSPMQGESPSSCCRPKPAQQPVARPVQQSVPAQSGGCCSSKAKQAPEPVQVKSCCSGSKTQANVAPNPQTHNPQHPGQHFQFQLQSQGHALQYPNFQATPSAPSSFPFALGAPIYNHAAAAYQQLHSGPGSMASPVATPQIGQYAPEHNCHCGESCSCFGCAAHPNNATMMEYVRLMAQFQYTGGFGTMSPPLYDLPTHPHHPGYGAEAHQMAAFPNLSHQVPPQIGFQAGMDISAMSNTALASSSAWQHTPTPQPSAPEPQFYEPSNYVASTPITETPPTLKTEMTADTPAANSPKDEDTPTLSPSSYFWNQMVLPNCSDATGTCQCGDGCECVGCLTHGGHNGVQLEAPALDGQHAFSNFSADSNLHLGAAAEFLYNPAHT